MEDNVFRKQLFCQIIKVCENKLKKKCDSSVVCEALCENFTVVISNDMYHSVPLSCATILSKTCGAWDLAFPRSVWRQNSKTLMSV